MIGNQIRDGRLKLDMTQEDLAEHIGKKREFISRIENDDNSKKFLFKEFVDIGWAVRCEFHALIMQQVVDS